MDNPHELDECFNKYINDIQTWLPDGLIDIDIETLQQLDLLHFHTHGHDDSNMTRFFHVMETEDKLTLVNEEFVIWIAPAQGEETNTTCTLVALNGEEGLHLELGFLTKGIYNQSRLVLQVLEKLLLDIHTTESALKKLS